MARDETLHMRMTADTDEVAAALDDLSRRANAFGSALTSALKGAVTGGKSLDQVLQGLARRMTDMALDAALAPLSKLIGGAAENAFGALVGAFSASGARVTPFAQGGVVANPSFFPHGGGLGLMGEAGAEAILPLRRGADGRLGVSAPTGRQGGASVVFNVTTQNADSFLKAETQVQAMLARAAGRGRRGL